MHATTALPHRTLMVATCLAMACSPRQGERTTDDRSATATLPAAQPNDSETALGAPSGSRAPDSSSDTAAPSAPPTVPPAAKKPTSAARKPTASGEKQVTQAEQPATPSEKPADAPAPAATPAAAPQGDEWVTYDAASNTVTFKLEAGPFSFNGFTNGGATLTVPPKSTVVMNFVQNDGTPHSAEVASGEGPLPNAGGDPAIPRAYTNKVVEGLPQGAKDVIRFTAPESGSYRIICGVPGHALSGMWLWLKIDPTAKAPTFGATK
jgi:plastocyanin